MTNYIVTFGSCLAANVANELEGFNRNFYRISSVQHNRIDQFIETYIQKNCPPLKESDMNLKVKTQYSNVNVFRNQFEDVELGKSLPFKRDPNSFKHPIDAIKEGKLYLLIIDNYPDMFFKVYKHKEKGTKFFINKAYLVEEPSTMEFINEFLDPYKAVQMYINLIQYCKRFNPNLFTIFIHFPINLKNNSVLTKRENEFIDGINKIKKEENQFFIIPPRNITVNDLSNPTDPYHFRDEVYKEYAKECEKLILCGLNE
jgi:hypothetical protein